MVKGIQIINCNFGKYTGLPRWHSATLPANARDIRDTGLITGLENPLE